MPWKCFMVNEHDDPELAEKPGAIYSLPDPEGNRHWLLCLPNGAHWNIYGKSADGSGWNITGNLPNITARPSINSLPNSRIKGYHGWLTDGVLSDDLSNQTYTT